MSIYSHFHRADVSRLIRSLTNQEIQYFYKKDNSEFRFYFRVAIFNWFHFFCFEIVKILFLDTFKHLLVMDTSNNLSQFIDLFPWITRMNATRLGCWPPTAPNSSTDDLSDRCGQSRSVQETSPLSSLRRERSNKYTVSTIYGVKFRIRPNT